MSHFTPQEFYYRLGWRTRSVQSGMHPTKTTGGHADFQNYVPFLENPNPRRVDVRATLRTVPRQLMSRAYYERGSVAVYVIVDFSDSMRFVGNAKKYALVADIVASAAWSASRSGDSFGLVVCDDEVRMDLFQPPSYRRGMAHELHTQLLTAFRAGGITRPMTHQATSLVHAAQQLRQKRSLVFLISDFHLPGTLIDNTLNSLATHDVVPIVIWDGAEYADIPSWGWARVRDMEGGGDRSLFLRPKLNAQIKASYMERRRSMLQACIKAGARAPFFVEDTFNAEHLTRHLLESH